MSGQDVAIIVGAGSGLSASLARRFSSRDEARTSSARY